MLDAAPAHVERLDDGTEVKLGVFLSNTMSRRGKFTADKRPPSAPVVTRRVVQPGERPDRSPHRTRAGDARSRPPDP
ncbi:hypothetical protein FNV68_54730 [Streptomyces sp. S1D4-23]|nr:hypothetical protein FNV61_53670 [Streptomyces sp. RLB3-6]QDO13915.1 hypothetical protein FNV68_54730 [Streptomyces sp. S1D4-23]